MAGTITMAEVHQALVDVYLEHQKNNSGFTFNLRKRNHDKMRQGHWFQGTDDYVTASPYKLSGGAQKTPAIYFEVYGLNSDGQGKVKFCIAAVYPKTPKTPKHKEFMGKVIEEIIGVTDKLKDRKRYLKPLGSGGISDAKEALKLFLEKTLPQIEGIAFSDSVGLQREDLYYSEKEFARHHERIVDIKNNPQMHSELVSGDDSAKNPRTKPQLPLNVIFYGPPGTGKTYKTVQRALEIIEGKDLSDADRDDLLERFNVRRDAEQIEMITFHQNLAYEDFIEGIKPNLEDGAAGSISYKIEDGILKKIANLANYYGVSEKGEKDSDDLSDLLGHSDEDSVKKLVTEYAHFVAERLKKDNKIQLTGAAYIVGVDKAKGCFNITTSGYSGILRFDYINILFREYEKNNIKKGNDVHKYCPLNSRGGYYLHLLREIAKFKINRDIFSVLDDPDQEKPDANKSFVQNYVLIIDEINRGNIAKIFGELITLIEPSKRLGQDEGLRVKLPYSREEFGVPDNLYIIGTMNTADRSLTLLDTALRRRFDFEEMMPDVDECPDDVEGIDCQKLLREINARIKKEHEYGRDHQIGHSYFMGEMEGIESVKLIFQRNILPLLQEYFFDDWKKIAAVLKGSDFVQEVEEGDSQIWEWLPYTDDAWNKPSSYIAIYKEASDSTKQKDSGEEKASENATDVGESVEK